MWSLSRQAVGLTGGRGSGVDEPDTQLANERNKGFLEAFERPSQARSQTGLKYIRLRSAEASKGKSP